MSGTQGYLKMFENVGEFCNVRHQGILTFCQGIVREVCVCSSVATLNCVFCCRFDSVC